MSEELAPGGRGSPDWGRRLVGRRARRRPRRRGARRVGDGATLVGSPDRRSGRREHHAGNAARPLLRVRLHVPADLARRPHPPLAPYVEDDPFAAIVIGLVFALPNLMTLSDRGRSRERRACRRSHARRRRTRVSRRVARGSDRRGLLLLFIAYLMVSRDRAHSKARHARGELEASKKPPLGGTGRRVGRSYPTLVRANVASRRRAASRSSSELPSTR